MKSSKSPVRFTITAEHTAPTLAGHRQALYFGEKPTQGAAARHAQTTVERLQRKHGGSFARYRVEYGNWE